MKYVASWTILEKEPGVFYVREHSTGSRASSFYEYGPMPAQQVDILVEELKEDVARHVKKMEKRLKDIAIMFTKDNDVETPKK